MTTTLSPEEFNAILRSDFRSFVLKAIAEADPGIELKENWHIDAICYHVKEMIFGDSRRAIINIPPRHLKSLISSVILPTFLIGLDPSCEIACVSYADNLALDLAAKRRRILRSSRYKTLFPNTVAVRDTAEEFATDQGGRILATSIGGSLTGMGFDWIIIDDPIKTSAETSAAERDSANNWYSNTAYTRLNDKGNGRILLVMQRVHPDDMTAYVLDFNPWDHLCLKAIATEAETIPTGEGRSYNRVEGELLHPTRENESDLEAVRRTLGSYNFEAQYQQSPVPAAGNIIQRDWLRTFPHTFDRGRFEQIIQSWDCAAEVGDGNSYSVGMTFGTIGGRAFLIDVYRDRLRFPDLVKKVKRLAQQKGADRVYIEKASTGISVCQSLHGVPSLNLIPVIPRADKLSRVAQASAFIEAGRLYLPEEAPWLGYFLGEMMAFPHGKFDDQVDALTQFILHWQKPHHRVVHVRAWNTTDGPRFRDRYAERMGGGSVFGNLF